MKFICEIPIRIDWVEIISGLVDFRNKIEHHDLTQLCWLKWIKK